LREFPGRDRTEISCREIFALLRFSACAAGNHCGSFNGFTQKCRTIIYNLHKERDNLQISLINCNKISLECKKALTFLISPAILILVQA